MVFRWLSGGGSKNSSSNGDEAEGKRLYDLGLEHANAWRMDEALKFFDASFEANRHPAPLIDRAHIKLMRLRHYEAMQDVLEARRLDSKTGNAFLGHIHEQLSKLTVTTEPYRNGTRDLLIKDMKEHGVEHAAKKILHTCFKPQFGRYESIPDPTPEMKFHFFNELDTIAKFDSPGTYPEADGYVARYPSRFIEMQIEMCPDPQRYQAIEVMVNSFLCAYAEQDMRLVRRRILYDIHQSLMWHDWDTGAISSRLTGEDSRGVIREAHKYLDS